MQISPWQHRGREWTSARTPSWCTSRLSRSRPPAPLRSTSVNAVQTTIQKLAAGITVRGTEYKLGTEDPDAIAASWIVLYEIVKMKYQASITAAAPIPTPTPTPPTAASSATDKDTIPKTLPAGVYNQLVKDYNDVTLNGEKREFPEKVLLGADKVLARMRHEHTVSKHYTAVTLGEIMSQRLFTALGTVNSTRKKDDLDKRLVVDSKHQLVSKEPSDWDVRGLNMIQDGIDAVRWAWILIKFGTEKAVNKYCDWWITLVRRNSTKLPQIKTLWESFAWDIAVRMRQTETFNTITDELMADLSTVNDALMQSPRKKQRTTDNHDRYQERPKRAPRPTARAADTKEEVEGTKGGGSNTTPHHGQHSGRCPRHHTHFHRFLRSCHSLTSHHSPTSAGSSSHPIPGNNRDNRHSSNSRRARARARARARIRRATRAADAAKHSIRDSTAQDKSRRIVTVHLALPR